MRNGRTRLAAASVLVVVAASACDWLQPSYDAGHSGANPAEPALTAKTVGTLTPRFVISAAGRIYGQPIVAGHTLYVTSQEFSTNTARLEQFDAATGRPSGSTALSTAASGVTDPAWASGTIYVGIRTSASNGNLLAVSSSTGTVQWSAPLPSRFGPLALSVDRGMVFVLTRAAGFIFIGEVKVVALNRTTGVQVWATTVCSSAYTANGMAITSGGFVAVAYNCGANPMHPPGFPETSFLKQSDGSMHGNVILGTLAASADGLVYGQTVASPNDVTEAVEPSGGTPAWTHAPVGFGAAVNSRDVIFSRTSGLTALDASTGADRWTTFPELSNVQAVSSPVVAGGVAYVVTYDGANATLRTYDASNGTAIGSFNVPTPTNVFELAAPVVSNGTVYVNLTGTVTAYAPP